MDSATAQVQELDSQYIQCGLYAKIEVLYLQRTLNTKKHFRFCHEEAIKQGDNLMTRCDFGAFKS